MKGHSERDSDEVLMAKVLCWTHNNGLKSINSDSTRPGKTSLITVVDERNGLGSYVVNANATVTLKNRLNTFMDSEDGWG